MEYGERDGIRIALARFGEDRASGAGIAARSARTRKKLRLPNSIFHGRKCRAGDADVIGGNRVARVDKLRDYLTVLSRACPFGSLAPLPPEIGVKIDPLVVAC